MGKVCAHLVRSALFIGIGECSTDLPRPKAFSTRVGSTFYQIVARLRNRGKPDAGRRNIQSQAEPRYGGTTFFVCTILVPLLVPLFSSPLPFPSIQLTMSRDDRGTTQPSLQAILQTEAVQEALLNTGLYNAKTNTAYSFQVVWEQESRRVAKIIKERQEGMEITAKKLLVRSQNAEKAASSSKRREEIHAELQDIRRATNMVVSDSIVLQDFLTSSRNALWNIAITADKRLALKLTSLVQELFPKIHLNTALVCVVSDLYHTIKQAEAILKTKANTGDTVWQAPSSFERNTTKYWVKDEDLTELLMACAIEAPLLVYGKKGPLTATATRRDLETSEGDKLWDSLATRITSVYFDSTDMNLYKHRLARAEGAQLLRARWYGSTMPVGEKIIFLELKTHHERWVTQKSVKERASIQERDMVTFLKPTPWNKTHAQEILLRATPTLKDKDLAKATNLLLRMHNLVVNNKLTACVRSVYYRAAFQSAKSNGESIHIAT